MQHVRLHLMEEMKFAAWSHEQQHKYPDYNQHSSPPDCTCWLCVCLLGPVGALCSFPHPATAELPGAQRQTEAQSRKDQAVWGHSCPPAENRWGNDPSNRRRSWERDWLRWCSRAMVPCSELVWYLCDSWGGDSPRGNQRSRSSTTEPCRSRGGGSVSWSRTPSAGWCLLQLKDSLLPHMHYTAFGSVSDSHVDIFLLVHYSIYMDGSASYHSGMCVCVCVFPSLWTLWSARRNEL